MLNRTPTISFVIPTHAEDRPLPRAVWSIAPQLLPGDEVLVIGDVHDRPLPNVEAACRIFRDRGYNVRYLEHDAGHHCWGHCQIGFGFDHAVGDLLHVNDDDDIWTRDAAEWIRRFATNNPDRPLLFRFVSYFGTTYWEVEGLFARNHIGGHCLVQPNVLGKIGKPTCEYSGDFDMLDHCIQAYGGIDAAVWVDKTLCLARPVAQLAVT